jgi:hypothetical protein
MAALSHIKSDTIGDFTGTVTVFNSQGSTATVAATDLVRPSDWNSAHNFFQTISGNTLGQSTASGTNLVIGATDGVSVSLSTAAGAATLWVDGISPNSRFVNEPSITQVGTVMGNSLVSVVPFNLPSELNMSNLRWGASINVATAANNSSAYLDVSASAVLYSRNVSTLSSMLSASNSYTATWSSNATGTVTGVRGFTADWNATTKLPPGEYWIAVHMSTNNTATGGAATTALGNSVSMMVGASAGTAGLGLDPFFQATQATRGVSVGLGMISTGVTRGTIPFTEITQTGTRAMCAKLWIDMRNWSVW